ncbi:contact-dependent growth inhibition system immunity protein [Streptomyces bauhiniae]|uniref:contact-dependent growth inhibition system immunity protein n=1 Tax=Streptomyces bauhiniae TaxID=2340725 RepID=UPI003637AF37
MPVQQTPERALWPAPSVDHTRLVTTAHALRRRPIGDLTVEDMRLLIGQDMGLPYLLPLALEVLRENPMAEGGMYEGDLLSAVLTRNPSTWSELPELGRELRVIAAKLTGLSPDLQQKAERFLATPLLGWTRSPRWPGTLRTISSSRPRIVVDHSTRRPAKPWSAQIPRTPGWSRMTADYLRDGTPGQASASRGTRGHGHQNRSSR